MATDDSDDLHDTGTGDVAQALLGTLAPGFRRRISTLHPGQRCDLQGPWWRDALVVVLRGAVVLTTAGGDAGSFVAGSVLTFAGLEKASLTNAGEQTAVVLSVAREVEPRDDSET